ncbi:MAG: hypothetical protein Q8903_07390, partial [Bacteroidota bacterium]|nr:hypothetical protein [Bacteroidota bacterium]
MSSVFEKEFRISHLALIVFFTGIIIYSFSFTVSFNNDEIAFIQRTEIKTVDNLISLCGKQEFDGVYYRPLGDVISGFITLAIKYYTPGYRVINAVLNAINGILLFLTGLYIFRTTPHRKAISFWAAIFFLLHPINNYAVIWHTALFERVFLSFYLLALLLFLKKGQWGVLSLISFLAALMSKEMAFSFPFVIFLVSFYLNKKNGIKKALSDFMPYAILTFSFIAFRIISFNNNVFTNQEAHAYISFFAIIKNYLFFIGAMIFPFFLKDVESFLQMHNYIIFIIIPFAGLLSYWIYKKYDKKLL